MVASASELRVVIDPRIELLTLLFHLAGNPEYRGYPNPHLRRADDYFKAVADDPAVVATKSLHDQQGISHNAPASFAILLDDHYRLRAPLPPFPDGLDERWKKAPIDAYVPLLDAFATKTHFDRFLADDAGYTAKVASAFVEFLGDKPLVGWFDAAFAPRPRAVYALVPGFFTGPWNFGLHTRHPDGVEEVVQVMMLEALDHDGIPHPGDLTHGLVAHELAHTYVNPIVDQNLAVLEGPMTAAAAGVRKELARGSYPTIPLVLYESIVRAVTVLYLRDRGSPGAAAKSLAEQVKESFLWTGELADALDPVRKKNGGRWPTADLVDTTRRTLDAWAKAH